MEANTPLLLTDEQMRKFITDGFLILTTDFSEDFHHNLMESLNHVYEEEGNPGNNLLPRVPELQRVFEHPVITGALTSVLGPNYMLHAHRHGHFNAVSSPGGWHKDSYWGYERMRNHHPWWAMIMYFPQDTPVELGPTGIMPGTQNYESRVFDADEMETEALASGNAGTFALIHYDIWHRSTPNLLGEPRYMLKFEFMRTLAPEAPSWNNTESAWRKPQTVNSPFADHDVMWEETWNWLSGKTGRITDIKSNNDASIQELTMEMQDQFEPIALNATYELARRGKHEELFDALQSENVKVSRLAAYGLSVSSKEVIPGLIENLESRRVETIIHSIFALGEQREQAKEAVSALNKMLEHPSEKVRRAVVEALGMIQQPTDDVVDGLCHSLKDEDVQVRFMAGLSLSRLGPSAEKAVPQLEIALNDENRYVRAHAAEALRYINTEQAKDVLIKFLFNSRWCPTTTKVNTFYP